MCAKIYQECGWSSSSNGQKMTQDQCTQSCQQAQMQAAAQCVVNTSGCNESAAQSCFAGGGGGNSGGGGGTGGTGGNTGGGGDVCAQMCAKIYQCGWSLTSNGQNLTQEQCTQGCQQAQLQSVAQCTLGVNGCDGNAVQACFQGGGNSGGSGGNNGTGGGGTGSGSLGCAQIIQCMGNCGANQQCVQECYTKGTPQGQQALQAFATCLQTSCMNACSGTDANACQSCAQQSCSAQMNACMNG
jgi:hypothetical protein